MTKLLTRKDIETMRKELCDDANRYTENIGPPPGREYWDVYRIVATLEHMQSLISMKFWQGFGIGVLAGVVWSILAGALK